MFAGTSMFGYQAVQLKRELQEIHDFLNVLHSFDDQKAKDLIVYLEEVLKNEQIHNWRDTETREITEDEVLAIVRELDAYIAFNSTREAVKQIEAITKLKSDFLERSAQKQAKRKNELWWSDACEYGLIGSYGLMISVLFLMAPKK